MAVEDIAPMSSTSCSAHSRHRTDLLNKQFGIPGIAQIVAGHGNLPKVRIRTDVAQGEIYLYGAQVTSWIPAGFGEVLFLSDRSRWEVGSPVRGGIPICFPWFSGWRSNSQAPRHGFVRTKEWQINSIELQNDEVTVVCSTETDAATLLYWPHKFRALLCAVFGRTLCLELTVINVGSQTMEFEEALHTYLRIGHISEMEIRGLEGSSYLDYTDSCRTKLQSGKVTIVSETDRVYYDNQNPLVVDDALLGRVLQTTKHNSKSTIVWNPWKSAGRELGDLNAHEWQHMICIESGNVLGNSVVLLPGEKWSTRTLLTVHQRNKCGPCQLCCGSIIQGDGC